MYRNTLNLTPVEKFLTGLLAIVLMIAGFFAGLLALAVGSAVVLVFLARIAWDRRILSVTRRHRGKDWIDGKYRVVQD